MPLTDEVCAAIEVLHAPDLEGEIGLGHAALAAMLLAVPGAFALLVETHLLLAVLRIGRGRATAVALAGMAAAFALTAAFPPLLPVAMLALYPLQGVACGVAQAGVVAASPGAHEQALARWATAAAVGDLVGPLLCAGVAAAGFGWRWAFAVGAVWIFVHAVAAATTWAEPPGPDEDVPTDVRSLIRDLLADPPLAKALLVTLACELLDEVLIIFGALWLAQLGVGGAERNLMFACQAVGLVVGSALVEPALRYARPSTLMIGAGASCAIAYAWWWWAPGAVALGLVGLFGAALYPLAEARPYALASPSRVAAAHNVVGMLAIGIPVILGLIADRFGVHTALALLIVEPIVLLAVGIGDRYADRRATN